MNTMGIDDNLNRARIRKLLSIGLFGAIITGIGTMFLSFGNAFMFGGLLITMPDQRRFDEFRKECGL